MSPLVTVYITNHNYEKYIEQAIKSVLAQTFGNFELIIIDDGSTDNSRAVIERYESDPRIRVIYQENRGLNVSNNIALRSARGKYVIRLDADDYFDENALNVLAGVLERKPEVGMVFPDYYHVDGEGQVLELVRRHDFKTVTLLDSPAHGACTLIRTQCLRDLGGYPEEFTCQDGYDLWLRFVERYNVENVNLPLFYYRRHGENLTGNENRILETRGKILRNHAVRRKSEALNTVTLIPIRGPKVDPNSVALKPLGDKVFLDWTVEAALASEELKRIVVSSPDESVLKHVQKRYGKKIYTESRPVKLARENFPLDETVTALLANAGADEPDAILTLFIETPFRSVRYIDKALDAMKIFDLDSVIGVRLDTDQLYRHTGEGLEPLRKNDQLRLEREELYRRVGGMALCRYGHFKKNGSLLGGRMGHVVLDQMAAMRAVSELDVQVMQCLAKTAFVGKKGGA